MSGGSLSILRSAAKFARPGLQSSFPMTIANEIQNRVQVVALTTNVSRIRSWEAAVFSLGPPRKAMADQIRTVAKERLRQKLGTVSAEEMNQIEIAIRVQLGL